MKRWLLLLCLSSSLPALAAPAYVPVQLYLTDAAGAPLDGTHNLTMTLYSAAAGGTTLYSESQTVVVRAGLAVVHLGADGGLSLALFRDNASAYLGIKIDDDAEMVPRFSIGSVPYAGYAEYAGEAASLEGLSASDFRLASDAITWAELEGVPAGLDDGDDVFTAGAGVDISLTGEISVEQATIEGWAQDVCYDSAAEVVAAIGPHYTDGDAVAAMGTKSTANPLHHDRYTDAEAVAAMGIKSNTNDLNHDRYTDTEAKAAADDLSIGLTNCAWSGYVNDMDELVDYTCPTGKVMVGAYSYHSNDTEDRRWQFRCCSLDIQ